MQPLSAPPSSFTVRILKVLSGNEIHHIPVAQIIRLEAKSNYTYIYVVDHKKLMMAKVLSAYETLLAPLGFIRVHRSHLVNPLYVQTIHMTGEVVMADDSRVVVSRRKKKMVENVFRAFLHPPEMTVLNLNAAS